MAAHKLEIHPVLVGKPVCLPLASSPLRDYASAFRKWGRRFPRAGYGGRFSRWLHSESLEPYNSYGNGSAMRVSPIGWLFGSLEETLAEAKRSAEATHGHPEGIKGAQATAAATFWAGLPSGQYDWSLACAVASP